MRPPENRNPPRPRPATPTKPNTRRSAGSPPRKRVISVVYDASVSGPRPAVWEAKTTPASSSGEQAPLLEPEAAPVPASGGGFRGAGSRGEQVQGPPSDSTPQTSAVQTTRRSHKLKAFTQAIMTVHHEAGIARDHLEELARLEEQSADEEYNPRKNRARSKSSHNVFAALEKEHATAEKSLFTTVMNWHFLPNGHENGRFRMVWDWLIVFFVILTTYWTPFRVAFLRVKVAEIQSWEYLVDSFFAMDMILTFFTAYEDGPTVVFAKGKVAKRYLKDRFFIDLVTTVPWDFIALQWTGNRNNRFVQMIRLTRCFRFLRLHDLMHIAFSNRQTNSNIIDAACMFADVFTVAHFLACVFFFLPFLCQDALFTEGTGTTPDHWICSGESWITSYDIGNANKTHTGVQYINALYWSFTTMTTIGYGDRGPKDNPLEIAFVIFAELVGLTFFSILLTEIVKVYQMLDKHGAEHRHRKNALVQYLSYSGISESNPSLVSKIITYMNFKHLRSKTQTDMSSIDGFSLLSENLQNEVRRAGNLPSLAGCRFFGHSSEQKNEVAVLKKRFGSYDADHSGVLDKSEVKQFFKDLDDTMNERELENAFIEMDETGDGRVAFIEFENWWFQMKHGSNIVKHNTDFMETLAEQLKTTVLCKGDVFVSKGQHEDNLWILRTGSATIAEYTTAGKEQKSVIKEIKALNYTPFIGIACCLPADERATVQRCTRNWEVTADDFCELFVIEAADLRHVLSHHASGEVQGLWREESQKELVFAQECAESSADGSPQRLIGRSSVEGSFSAHFASLQDDSQDRLDQIQTISVLLRLEQKIDSHTTGMNAQFAEKKQLDRIQQQIGESKAQMERIERALQAFAGAAPATPAVAECGDGDKVRAAVLARRNVATGAVVTPAKHTGRGRATTATPEGLSYWMDGEDIRFDEPPRR